MEKSSALSCWATATSQQIEPLEIPCDHPRLKSSDKQTTASGVETPFAHSIELIDQIATQCDVRPEDSARDHIAQLSKAFSRGEIHSFKDFEVLMDKIDP